MKIIRILFGTMFLFLTVVIAIYSTYFVWLAAIGIGWSGRDMGLMEFVWMVKAPILMSLFSFIACVGLFLNKRWGSLFGLALGIVAMFMCSEFIIIGIGDGSIKIISDLLDGLLYLFISFGITVGLLKLIYNAYEKFKPLQYLTVSVVVSSVLLSYYTLFQ